MSLAWVGKVVQYDIKEVGVYLGKSKDILLHPLCAFGPPPVALFDQLVYFLHCPISFSAQIKFPECFSLSIFIYICIVQIAKSICPNFKKQYLSKLQNVFVQIAKCICPNCNIYLSKIIKIFDTIARSASKELLGGNLASVGFCCRS